MSIFLPFDMSIFPRGSEDQEIKIMIHGFETALEHALPNPRDIDQIYFIEEEHLARRLGLVDAIEQTCKIIMVDPMLLRAFTDIPRIGYSFYLYFDKNYDLWLHLSIQGKDSFRRCLGGGIESDSKDCLFSLPQYADVVATILMRIEKEEEEEEEEEKEMISLDQTDSIVLPPLAKLDVGVQTSADDDPPSDLDDEDDEMNDIDEVDASL